jgi:CBS domain-containing protein
LSTAAAPPEVIRFLRERPPFDGLPAGAVERVAGELEVEFHRAGTTIFSQGTGPVEHLRVVRSGAVEIIHDGRVLDLLGEGELFGHASMLSGLPAGFEARAAEDTLCYRLAAGAAKELLAAPAGLRFVARSLLEPWSEASASADFETPNEPAEQPVGGLVHAPAVLCEPDTSIREAARMMTAISATSAVIRVSDGSLGILTDRDLRSRVIADGLSGDDPVSAAMSYPAYMVGPERLGGEVLLEMLDRGFRHFPVVSATGGVLGVVEDIDLVAAQTRSPFFLRQRIARAKTVEDLVSAAAELRPAVIALHEARIAAINVMAVYSVIVDALTRRILEIVVGEAGEPEAPFAWLALGSQARREAVPSSDIDSAIVWFGDAPEEETRTQLHELGQTVVRDLERCGFHEDAHGASAADRLFVRSVASWQHAARSWIADPTQEQALILASVLVDSRPVWGIHTGTPVADSFRLAPGNEQLLRMLARFALSHRPPTGFMRGLVVEHSGEHRGRLDLKHGGIIPIVDLARWAGMAAGVTSAPTIERLHAAGSAGTLPATDAHTLEDAFELISSLRLEHQVRQLRAGEELDDYVDPSELSNLTRTHLRVAFRAISSIQKRVAAELSVRSL